MKKITFLFIAAISLSAFSSTSFAATAPLTITQGYSLPNLLNLINQQRLNNGLTPLLTSPALSTAAHMKIDDMVTNHYFAHISPSGEYFGTLMIQAGYRPQILPPEVHERLLTDPSFSGLKDICFGGGENLAVTNGWTPQELIAAWMASPEHRANILDTQWTDTGFAFATGTYEGQPVLFIAQYFGGYSLCK